MSADKHTPGPWRFVTDKSPDGRPSPFYRGLVALVSTDPALGVETSATVVTDGRTANASEWEANARLIAAAPDLLDALEEVINYRGGANDALSDEYVMDRVHAAIRKARGEE